VEALKLFWVFFKIGIVSFGGGWTIVGLIKSEVVGRGWMSGKLFAQAVAMAQITPGPVALNMATLVGYRLMGWAGSLLATGAVLLFPASAVCAALKFLSRPGIDAAGIQDALKVGTTALVAMTLASLAIMPGMKWITILLAAVSCLLSLKTKINPLLLILGSGAAGALLALLG